MNRPLRMACCTSLKTKPLLASVYKGTLSLEIVLLAYGVASKKTSGPLPAIVAV